MTKRWYLICFLVLDLILFVSCSDDSNPVSPDNSASRFTIYFDVDLDEFGKSIDVDFMTTNISEIPSVIVNGTAVEIFDVREGSIQARLSNLPYSDVCTFDISAGGKTTSGTINMPADVSTITCNGTDMVEDSTVYVEAAETYNFAWSSSNADYFVCGFSNTADDIVDEKVSKTASISYDATGYTRYRFDLKSFVGALLESGAKPNVSGDYGDGYMVAESYNQDYRITNIHSGKIALIPEDEKELSKFKMMQAVLDLQ